MAVNLFGRTYKHFAEVVIQSRVLTNPTQALAGTAYKFKERAARYPDALASHISEFFKGGQYGTNRTG